jgi:hypothetical protein
MNIPNKKRYETEMFDIIYKRNNSLIKVYSQEPRITFIYDSDTTGL